MTNHEKFIEIFGETGEDVKAAPSWLAKEYNGPVVITERNKFIKWLDTLHYIKYEIARNNCIYITDRKGNAIMRVSGLDDPQIVDGEKCAYIRWGGLVGYKSIDGVKDIIVEHERKEINGSVFNFESLYNEIFGRRDNQ